MLRSSRDVDGNLISVAMRQDVVETPALKNDSDKTRLDLLSPIAIEELGKVLTFGQKKYTKDGVSGAHNWRKGLAWSRVLGATLRHVFAYLNGQDLDPETGLSHLAHAMCCIMFLLEYQYRPQYKPLDDRWVSP